MTAVQIFYTVHERLDVHVTTLKSDVNLGLDGFRLRRFAGLNEMEKGKASAEHKLVAIKVIPSAMLLVCYL